MNLCSYWLNPRLPSFLQLQLRIASVIRVLGVGFFSFCFRQLKVKYLNSNVIFFLSLLSVYTLGPFIKGVTGASGLARRKGASSSFVFVRQRGWRLQKLGEEHYSNEPGAGMCRKQTGVSAAKTKIFLGSRKKVSLLQLRKMFAYLESNPGSKDLSCIHTVSRGRLVYRAL